jgi:hypothetical protein
MGAEWKCASSRRALCVCRIRPSVGTCDWRLLHTIEAPVVATGTGTEPSCEAKPGFCLWTLLAARYCGVLLLALRSYDSNMA